ncbi:MAG: hypothetical protein A3F90_11075 [Deltaproteobacteria bacterium RIFCSPLOWO2_12_FULL_60_19]|nr:MAG: hypothetical protein A3F90_11075 [Deltaproteobacteria bacterium RIFCSPLOWO2_12_FULL_60_19]
MDTVSGIIAVGALVVSVFSALAASRSAKASETSASLAKRTLERLATREIISNAFAVVAEASRIADLTKELRPQYRTQFTFAGQPGCSNEQRCLDQLDEKDKKASELSQEATRLTADQARLNEASEKDLTRVLGNLERALSQSRPLREGLERELSDVSAQNAQDRAKRI